MGKDKACPVILRTRQSLEILAFKHPLAGLQLVKGSVEPGESTEAAAVRELLEEAGITGKVIRDLGTWHSASTGHTWAFHQCLIPEDLPDTWTHFAEDDGGHEFQFFWHPLASEPSEEWHQVFKDALEFLKPRLAEPLQVAAHQRSGLVARVRMAHSAAQAALSCSHYGELCVGGPWPCRVSIPWSTNLRTA
eukprot:gene22298-26459_t